MGAMAGNPTPDQVCVSQVLSGDESAAQALVERLQPLVAGIVRRRLPGRMDEADMVQTVFMNVFAKLDQYSGKAPLAHWVSRIAINACLNEIRRERNRPEVRRADLSEEQDKVLEFLTVSDAELSPHHQVAARELLDRVLERLSPREHLVITMFHLEGRTFPEISEATGWSALGVKVLAFRARQKMKKALKHLLQDTSR